MWPELIDNIDRKNSVDTGEGESTRPGEQLIRVDHGVNLLHRYLAVIEGFCQRDPNDDSQ